MLDNYKCDRQMDINDFPEYLPDDNNVHKSSPNINIMSIGEINIPCPKDIYLHAYRDVKEITNRYGYVIDKEYGVKHTEISGLTTDGKRFNIDLVGNYDMRVHIG